MSAETPKRIYCRTSICVTCAFSFVETSVLPTGEKVVLKHFSKKLKLSVERVNNIRSVIPDFVGSSTDDSNGVCVKCYRRVENIRKMTKEIENQTTSLRLSWKTVENIRLTLLSPRKHTVTKRLLRSPLSTQQPKAPKPFPATVVRKHPIQLLPLQALPFATNSTRRPICSDIPQMPGIENLPTYAADRTERSTKRTAKRSIKFDHLEKETEKDRPDGEVEVTVWYPSGKKTTILTDDTHKRMCMTIARGSNVEKVVADQIRSAKPGAIIEASARVVKDECQELCQRGSGTVMQDTCKSYDNLLHFTWEDFHKDLKTQCPGFLALLEAAVSDSNPDANSKHFRHVMMTAAVSLHGRNREMSLMQYVTAFVLMHGGCTQKNIERLAQLSMCVHPKTVHRKLMSWQANLHAELLALRDAWANGGATKYQLVGDNWDKNILPSYRTSDRKTVSLHLFNMYAVVDRVIPSPAVGFCKVLDATQLDVSHFIPSCDEQDQLVKELTFIVATAVVNNIPKLERCFKAIYPKHLHHTYSATAGVKTVQYPLGLFDCNENLTQELITLLANSLEKYVPMSDGDIVESVFLGGDRLTDERVQGAQNAMRNAPTAKEKLEGFISKTEVFHRLMNFLEAVTKMTYSTKSVNDRGTMHYYRNLLNARNVKGKVKNAYRPYKILYYTVLEGLCLALFMQHSGIEDLDADIPLPDGFSDMSDEDKIGWLKDICSTILRKWFFDSTQDVFHYLREVITDKDHPENYLLANLDKDTGRIHCHFCDKSYAYVGSLMSHEKKVHNVGIEKPLKKSKGTGGDELHSYILMLFKLLLLHKNLDTAVDMGDGERSVRSAKYELPIYNRTNKVKYCIGSIHLTSLSSGLLPKEQTERFVANRFINLQGGRNNNIALDEFIEMLNRDSKIACSGYKTKESIIRHSKEYPHLTNSIRHFDSLCAVRKSKGFHHLPSFKEDVAKVVKDLIEIDALNPQNQRTLHCKELVTERNSFDKCFHGLSTMVHRHKPSVPFRRLRDHHV